MRSGASVAQLFAVSSEPRGLLMPATFVPRLVSVTVPGLPLRGSRPEAAAKRAGVYLWRKVIRPRLRS